MKLDGLNADKVEEEVSYNKWDMEQKDKTIEKLKQEIYVSNHFLVITWVFGVGGFLLYEIIHSF